MALVQICFKRLCFILWLSFLILTLFGLQQWLSKMSVKNGQEIRSSTLTNQGISQQITHVTQRYIPGQIEDAKSPSTFYPLEPGKPGHFLIITGPPCSGKSTTAIQMATKYGFKYYEGDQIFYEHLQNPYLPLTSAKLNNPIGQNKLRFSQADEAIWGDALCDLFKNWDGKRRTECFKKRAKMYQVLARAVI